jgi:hypothetical protein
MSEVVLQFLINPEESGILLLLKISFLFLSLLFLLFIIITFMTTRWFRLLFWYDAIEFFTKKMYGSIWSAWRWRSLRWRSQRAREENYFKYIVKGHKILAKLLERLVPIYQANSYGERLARTGNGTFSSVKDIWWAHELYRSVKNKEYKNLSQDDFKKLIQTYDQAFRDLEIIK